MSDRSGIASFQFVSYKIDNITLRVLNDLGVLASGPAACLSEMKFNIVVRNPSKHIYNEAVHYVCGLGANIEITDKNDVQIVHGTFEISGLFRADNMDLEKEQNMVQLNTPAVLMPYLRSAITTVLAQSGFGSVILPLINIYDTMKQNPVKVLDFTKVGDTDTSEMT